MVLTREDVAAHKARIDAENRENYMQVGGVMKGGQYRYLIYELRMLYGPENVRAAVTQ